MNKVINFIVSLLCCAFSIFLLISINNLNVLPNRIFIIIVFGVIVINLIIILFLNILKKKVLKILGYILSFITIIGIIIGLYYTTTTNNFLKKAFNNVSNTYEIKYYVAVNKESSISDLKDVSSIGYYNNSNNIEKALLKIKDIKTNKYDDASTLFNDVKNNTVDGMLIEKVLYDTIVELGSDNYKIIYEFDIEVEEKVVKSTNNNSDVYNIYIGGTDFTNQYYDFNMIVSVNNKTNKILLTSIPRDFYLTIKDKGVKDILGYHGVWGVNTSITTLEDLFNTKIDYYVKINTNSLVNLVDTVGGIEFCSDSEFVTTHALVLDTYDDSRGRKLYVKKGCQHVSGIEALTIARERKNVSGGDYARQQNCQKIIISIFDKIAKFDTLTNYQTILNSVSSLYTTNIPSEIITSIPKNMLESGKKYTFETQTVNGKPSRGLVHVGAVYDFVAEPDYDTVNAASNKMNDFLNQK